VTWSRHLRDLVAGYNGAKEVLDGDECAAMEEVEYNGLQHDLYELIFKTIAFDLKEQVHEHVSVNSHELERRGSVVWESLKQWHEEMVQEEAHRQQQRQRQALRSIQASGIGLRSGQSSGRESQDDYAGERESRSGEANGTAFDCRQGDGGEDLAEVMERYNRVGQTVQPKGQSLDDYGERVLRYYSNAESKGDYYGEGTKIDYYLRGLRSSQNAEYARTLAAKDKKMTLLKLAASMAVRE
jgi:hypothetical protein